jgi:hypothetical protein
VNRLRTSWANTPKGIKIGLNLLLIALTVLLWYIFAGTPTYSMTQAYRRTEKAELLGPGDILAERNVEFMGFNRLLIAETDRGGILYTYLLSDNTTSSASGQLIYREKTNGAAIIPTPLEPFSYTAFAKDTTYPIFVIDNWPDAVRGELELTLFDELNGAAFSGTYSLRADRTCDSLFVFELSPLSGDGYGEAEAYAINSLGRLAQAFSGSLTAYPVTLRLYDKDDALLLEYEGFIRSEAGYAHERNAD